MLKRSFLIIFLVVLSSASLLSSERGISDVPVADAALRSDLVKLRSLLEQGVDVNSAQGDGMTALHWAARNDDIETAEILFYAGANLEARTRLGAYTPLLIAARNGSSKMVRALLDAGANPEATTTSGATPLMLASASGEVSAVESLLDHGVDIHRQEAAMGQTALMFGAAAGRTQVVELLLARGANPAQQSSIVDMAAMAEKDSALKKERDERMKELKEARLKAHAEESGATEKTAEDVSDTGKAGLENGAAASDVPAEVSARTVEKKGKEKASEPAKKENDNNSKEKKRGFLSKLFGWAGPDKDKKDAKAAPPRQRSMSLAEQVGHMGGLTALHLAAREGNLETVKQLLAGGADINRVTAGDHSSPLLIAALNGRFDLAIYLLEQGADPNLASDANSTPLYATINVQWAPHAFYPQPSTRQEETTHLELIRALLDKGADPNIRLRKKVWYTGYNFDQSGVDEAGATPFWRAAQSSDVEALRILVAEGADPTIPTQIGPERRLPNGRNADSELEGGEENLGGPAVSPLHAATGAGFDGNYHRNSPAGWMPAVRYLVEELGADVNEPDNKGYTALHNAAARGDNEMIRYLISKGADVMAVSKSGQTTADMANGPVQRIQPFPETLALLMELGAQNSGKCVSC